MPEGTSLPGATELSSLSDMENTQAAGTEPKLLPGTVSINATPTASLNISPTSTPRPDLKRSDTKAQLTLYESLGVAELLTSGPTEAIYKVWQSLDTNGNGSLSKTEFDEVNKRLA